MDYYSLLFYTTIFLLSYFLTQHLLRIFHNLPPAPFPTLPILGHLYLLRNPSSAHRTLAHLSARYGPILSLHLGSRRALLVSSSSAAEDCLAHNDVVFANRPRFIGGKILGYDYTNILWAPYGPLWRAHRRIAATEILSPHRLNLLSGIRADEIRWLVRRMSKTAADEGGDGTVEVKRALNELTNNVMMRMIAGKRFYGEGSETQEAAKRFREMLNELLDMGGAAGGGDFFPWLRRLGFFKGDERRLEEVFVKMDRIFQELVDEKRQELSEERELKLSSKSKCLIEVLLELQKSDPSYSTDAIVKGLVQILLLAGSETSASTIEWTLSLLLNHPEVLKKLQKEIEDHVGYERLLEENDLSHLPYLHCIINETLRMYPVAPILPPHESSDDCVVGGYRIPRGTMLMVNVWAIQNDPNVWEHPRQFKPERFQNVEGDRKLGYKFLPFGTGRRACPGENLAMRVVALAVGTLVQCFHWERVGEELVDMEEKFSVSMWKAQPLQAKCRPRPEIANLISSICSTT